MKFYIAGNYILQLNDKSCSFKKQTERDVDLDWQKPDFQSQVCTWSSRVSTNIQEAKSVLTPVRAATPCQESLSSSSDFVCERIKTNAFLFPSSNMAIQSSHVLHDADGRCSARICLLSRVPHWWSAPNVAVWASSGYTTATQGGIALAGGELGRDQK